MVMGTCCCTWVMKTVFPVVVTGVIPCPFGSEATPEDMVTAVEVLTVEAERVTATVATTPFGMVVVLKPNTRQFKDPDTGLQVTDLPAAVATAPAFTVMEDTSAAEYPMLHCREAGRVELLVSVMLRLTVEPGVPLPEESARVTPWAKRGAAQRKKTVRNKSFRKADEERNRLADVSWPCIGK
ncbi:MAG: hypothetical protein PGMFKBFP_01747 [Anaerolineales bacterium]|nr:hypothetical protein [Anaerolineales bacterium]